MKALILAAGYATRLYPLTKKFPKPLLKVRNRPIINYIVEKINKIDEIEEIIVVTNSKFFSKFKEWSCQTDFTKPIRLVDDLTKSDRDKRGAVGDMRFVINKMRIDDDLLVIGGDNIFDGDLIGFISFAKKKKTNPVIGVYNIMNLESAKKYGVIGLDANKKVVDFQEKPKKPKSTLVGMCLYYFPKSKLKLIRDYFKNKKKEHDAVGSYISWLINRASVYAYIFSGEWYDIGDYKFYNQAKKEFLN